ncbi:hypothetical protein DMC30DRAFT_387552 [Rhodotorula diobovata]|uniref:Uncharacterized protein n=1 Tax=Rhodotorula diobovata TaxID=5288 RepID=A0A5C5G8F5_9BASI|nr:hypothetical protein DMC30DRAFT_387552 [Rhodotorula diobovata]
MGPPARHHGRKQPTSPPRVQDSRRFKPEWPRGAAPGQDRFALQQSYVPFDSQSQSQYTADQPQAQPDLEESQAPSQPLPDAEVHASGSSSPPAQLQSPGPAVVDQGKGEPESLEVGDETLVDAAEAESGAAVRAREREREETSSPAPGAFKRGIVEVDGSDEDEPVGRRRRTETVEVSRAPRQVGSYLVSSGADLALVGHLPHSSTTTRPTPTTPPARAARARPRATPPRPPPARASRSTRARQTLPPRPGTSPARRASKASSAATRRSRRVLPSPRTTTRTRRPVPSTWR